VVLVEPPLPTKVTRVVKAKAPLLVLAAAAAAQERKVRIL
jgi:hypothetical protein